MDHFFGKDKIESTDADFSYITGPEDPSDYDANGLPTARKIERHSFSVPNATSEDGKEDTFDVDKFLTDHHQYQTLEDIEKQLQNWSVVLEKELVDLINQDYSKFVGLGISLNSGHPRVQDIKVEVLSFQKELKVIQAVLDESVSEVDSMLQKKFQIMEIENLVENLILYDEKLNDAESRVKEAISHPQPLPDSTVGDITNNAIHYDYTISELEELGVSVLACEHQLSKIPRTHPFVVAERSRLVALRLHVTSVYPAFFQEHKKNIKTDRKSIDSGRIFGVVLLYKQIKTRIDQDEHEQQKASKEELEKKKKAIEQSSSGLNSLEKGHLKKPSTSRTRSNSPAVVRVS